MVPEIMDTSPAPTRGPRLRGLGTAITAKTPEDRGAVSASTVVQVGWTMLGMVTGVELALIQAEGNGGTTSVERCNKMPDQLNTVTHWPNDLLNPGRCNKYGTSRAGCTGAASASEVR